MAIWGDDETGRVYSNETQDYYSSVKEAKEAEEELWWEEHHRNEEDYDNY